MAALLAVIAAVAGGNLAVSAVPAKPRAGQRVLVTVTGQVGRDGGRLYLYRNRGRPCATAVRGEWRRARHATALRPARDVRGSFGFELRMRAGRAGTREWVCGYLYAFTCDAAGRDCGPAVGLPPDAGFSRARIRVRPTAQARRGSAASR